MIIESKPGYMIEQEQLHNRGNGSSPVVTRVTRHDGLFCVELIGPKIRPSQIRVIDKQGDTHRNPSFWAYIHWVLNFNLHELRGMNPSERKAYIHRRMVEEGVIKGVGKNKE